MLSLIKTEWLKLKKYRVFWWMMAIVALTYPGINLSFYKFYTTIIAKEGLEGNLMKMLIGNPFAFPEAWHTIAYFSSWFILVPSILVIMVISNEYTYKTNRQNVIDGWSRKEFILSKLFIVLIISVIATIMFSIITIILGLNYSTEIQATRWAEQIKYVFLYLLQTFSQLSFAFFVGFIFKRSFISLGVFFFYLMILEPALTVMIDKYFELPILAKLLPIEVSDRLIPPAAFLGRFNKETYEQSLSEINLHILYTLIFTIAIWLLSIRIYNKRDL